MPRASALRRHFIPALVKVFVFITPTAPGVPGKDTDLGLPQPGHPLPAPAPSIPRQPRTDGLPGRKELTGGPSKANRAPASASPELKTHGETADPPPALPSPRPPPPRCLCEAPLLLPPHPCPWPLHPRESASSVPACVFVVPNLFPPRVEAPGHQQTCSPCPMDTLHLPWPRPHPPCGPPAGAAPGSLTSPQPP